jgi:hypothetical protein
MTTFTDAIIVPTGATEMHKRDEYRQRAEDCRKLARTYAPGADQAKGLEEMAQTWDRMADERDERIRRAAQAEIAAFRETGEGRR